MDAAKRGVHGVEPRPKARAPPMASKKKETEKEPHTKGERTSMCALAKAGFAILAQCNVALMETIRDSPFWGLGFQEQQFTLASLASSKGRQRLVEWRHSWAHARRNSPLAKAGCTRCYVRAWGGATRHMLSSVIPHMCQEILHENGL